MAYKDMREIVDTVTILKTIKPIYNFKTDNYWSTSDSFFYILILKLNNFWVKKYKWVY